MFLFALFAVLGTSIALVALALVLIAAVLDGRRFGRALAGDRVALAILALGLYVVGRAVVAAWLQPAHAGAHYESLWHWLLLLFFPLPAWFLAGDSRRVRWVLLEDRVFSAVILLGISPLLGAIAVGVKLTSPGPMFYRQTRVGWNGACFRMFKFRSMPVNAEAHSGPVWAQKSGGRATGFGRFLRNTSLDELPQFINVLKGDMSIVGPRPERPAFVHQFKDDIPGYTQKHLVKAGITGLAQVKGWRGNTDLSKRIEYDPLLHRTLVAVAGFEGHRADAVQGAGQRKRVLSDIFDRSHAPAWERRARRCESV